MHGHKSKFVDKGLRTKLKQEGFEKREKILKFKKMGRDEGTILVHKVKAKVGKV